MSNIKDGGPAFPFLEFRGAGPKYHQHTGLTLRDYFAAKAMGAMVGGTWPDTNETAEIVKRAYAVADAMLKAREAK